MDLKFDIGAVKGFLDPTEGRALFDHAVAIASRGPCLEIGSYCGKSTVYLGTACAKTGNTLYAIDHHQGSEEHQPGEEYHDEALFDVDRNKVDTFQYFRETIAAADLASVVVPIVAPSEVVGRHWGTSLGLVFIDGGHSRAAAHEDYDIWSKHIVNGGRLLIHDVFPNPADGGRPPFEVFERALASGQFRQIEMVKTLAVLERIAK